MNVCFIFAGPIPQEIAEVHVASVRRAIPGAWVIQLTDMETPQLRFVDEVRRKPFRDLLDARFAHQEDLPGDNLIIDYDCIVQRDVSDVFDRPFDVAVTLRPKDDVTASESVRKTAPHNLGVIFQRESGQGFWRLVRRAYHRLETDNWMDGQALVSAAIKWHEARFNLLELPGEIYNYTPGTEDEDVSSRAIVHYKGKRKAWMFRDAELRAKALEAGKRVLRIMNGSVKA